MKYSQKWALASFFDDLPAGYTFHKSKTPLHATLAGVFALERTGQEIAELLKKHLANTKTFKIIGGETEQWSEVKVTLLQKSEEFDRLFRSVQDVLISNSAVFNEPMYLGDGFKPHVTVQKTGTLKPHQIQDIKFVSLVDMFPDKDPDKRRIVSTVELKHD